MLEISCALSPLQKQPCPNSTVYSETPQVPKRQNYTRIPFYSLLTSLSANFQPGEPLALVLLWDQQWHWKSKGDAPTVAAFTSPASCKQWEKHKTEPVKQPRNTDFSYWPSADGGSGRDAYLLSLRSQHILSPQDLLAEWGDKADRKLK